MQEHDLRDQRSKGKSQARVSIGMVYRLIPDMSFGWGATLAGRLLPFASSKYCQKLNPGLGEKWLLCTTCFGHSLHMADQRVPSLGSEGCYLHHQLDGKSGWVRAMLQEAKCQSQRVSVQLEK